VGIERRVIVIDENEGPCASLSTPMRLAGSAAAIESADIALMTYDLRKMRGVPAIPVTP